MITQPLFISDQFIEQNTDYLDLIQRLKKAFSSPGFTVPPRQIYNTNSHKEAPQLFTMPAFGQENLGVKIVTIHPDNVDNQLPTINGCYILIDSTNGQLKAFLDAKSMTSKRTAAVSALASSFLSRVESSSLLVLGTGPLAKELTHAHSAVRPINKVFVWGRNFKKASTLVSSIDLPNIECVSIKDYRSIIKNVDIITSATSSPNPLIFGEDIVEGQHIDVVGSHKSDQRETDDLLVQKSKLFVDDITSALKEAGDVIMPIKNNTINKDHILGDLQSLCLSQSSIRTQNDITLFKSVGLALEDLIAARYYYDQFVSL